MLNLRCAWLCMIPVCIISAETRLEINDLEYFEMPGLNVMVFHDFYPEGHQGGISVIQNGERVATNGDIRLEPSPGQWAPVPKPGKREVRRDLNEISIALAYPDSSKDKKGFNPIDYPDLQLTYTIRVRGEGNSFRIIVDLDQPVPEEWAGRIGFNLELFPGLLFGKSYRMDEETGIFPRQASGPMMTDAQNETQIVPMAIGKMLSIAPESDALRCIIQSLQNPLELIDGRGRHDNGWFIVRSLVPGGISQRAVEWIVTPFVIPDWLGQPVIHVSQIGYHPNQKKIAVIELDKNDKNIRPVLLQRVEPDGRMIEVLNEQPSDWGIFLRYHYMQFDFSRVIDPGVYFISYGEIRTGPFQIGPEVYKRHVWQPTLEYFLPVQMCHMKVTDRYRIWHGLCHMDDARMAPINHIQFDGYSQGPSTLTDYSPGDAVPGLNSGGWHDAGDSDLRVESQAATVLVLVLIEEAFHVDYDATTIDPVNHLVEMHRPDGKPDILQQIEHGVTTLLGEYNSLGRFYRGIITPTLRQYVMLGDVSEETDNRFYDPGLRQYETKGDFSGTPDDRLVFTEENPRNDLMTASSLAAASRVLKDYNDSLSARCLDAAEGIWKFHEGTEARSKISAAIELYLTTGEKGYRDLLLAETDQIIKRMEWYGWTTSRVVSKINNRKFSCRMRQAMLEYHENIESQKKENPFGVPYRPQIWGAGWGIQGYGVARYYLHQTYPDIFTQEEMLDALNFVLGCHPGANTASFASGVGARSLTTAYGMNRADWSYIPGGVASGTALIRPDFPELKEWPFLWQQTEYVMGGGATHFMFLVLAADHILNQ